jgi:hypothetical protein
MLLDSIRRWSAKRWTTRCAVSAEQVTRILRKYERDAETWWHGLAKGYLS